MKSYKPQRPKDTKVLYYGFQISDCFVERILNVIPSESAEGETSLGGGLSKPRNLFISTDFSTPPPLLSCDSKTLGLRSK